MSAAVLGADDSRRMFGADFRFANLQPVWVEVANGTSQWLWLFRAGRGGGDFLPFEAMWSGHALSDTGAYARVGNPLYNLTFKNPIPPRRTRAGIVFTSPDSGTKLCDIDLSSGRALFHFSLFLPVPDDAGEKRFAEPVSPGTVPGRVLRAWTGL